MCKPSRIFLILFITFELVVLFGEEAFTQRILGGIYMGANLTQVDGDEYYGFHQIGLNVGPTAIIPFGKNKKWSVGFELLFSQKGSYHRGETDTTTYRLRLNYVDIPVLVHFTDKKIISAGAGIAYGQLVGAKETEYGEQTETNIQGPYSMIDFSVIGDVQFRLWKRLWLGLRYQYTILPIRTRDFYNEVTKESWTREQYNNVISIRLGWIFNQEVPIKKREKD
jgi:hypothetical protein